MLKGGESMERIEKKGLSAAELKEHKAELLPDRIEMHRRRRSIISQQTAVSNTLAFQQNAGVFIVVTDGGGPIRL